MKWVKERDLLIAQTIAFVQSVTGKKPDFSPAVDPQAAVEQPAIAKPDPQTVAAGTPAVETMAVTAAFNGMPATGTPAVEAIAVEGLAIERPAIEARPVEPTEIPANESVDPPKSVAHGPIKDIRLDISRVDLPTMQAFVSGEFRNEMKARVANFRAHQERFTREREAYFNSTLARLRTTIGTAPEPNPIDRTARDR